MITIGANGERIAYGIKHYNLDDESDLQKLPVVKNLYGIPIPGHTIFLFAY